ncbi:SusC/RagA family TonB-linked outer membrane protein [Sphingobacterium suaedae]|uniref:SusC/RagA family TonB-linked outer membrane protein n=1 Tax=Sphingobacterium suaedae TaxID=1686402 RepID=A0ABW5KEH3_9SPHI
MNRHLLTSLCVVACSALHVVNAQQTSVAGKITGADGSPISGVTITIKGTNQGTSSNESGLFSINAHPNAVLVISAVGYTDQEISLAGRKTLHVTLQSDETSLDEVMVVAYGTAKKSTYTGSAKEIKASDINDQPNASFEKALTGRVAGLQVTTTSGQAGATPSLRIRGIGSISASNEPLYVIDGVPVISGQTSQLGDYIANSNNVMSTLNPNDIESITVLKDAAASSLYGSRAANGVVIISTKRGKTGAPKIDIKSSVALSPSWATDNYESASVQDQIDVLYSVLFDSRKAAGLSDEAANTWVLNRFNNNFGKHGYQFSTSGTTMWEEVKIAGRTDGIDNREGKYFDWNDALFRTGVFNSNDIAVSGANEKTNYYSSLNYTSDKSRAILNNYSRVSGRVNLTQKIGKMLEFGSNINLARTKLVGMNDTRNTSTSYLFQTRNLLWPFYWPTDYKTGDPWTARYGSLAQNQLYYNNEWDNSSNISKISAIESITLRLLPELNLKTIFSYDETETKDHIYYSAKHYTGATDNGSVSEMSTNIQKLVSSTTANYTKNFGRHNIGILAGFEAEKNTTDYIRATGKDLPNSTLPTVYTAGSLDATAYAWGNTMMSVLSRAEYNFSEKYFASASFRRDGSSRLSPDSRWGNFWSVSGAWTISQESFLKDISTIDHLRLKASYGVNGTLPTGDFEWRPLVGYGSKYMTLAGGGLSNSANPNLSWERNYTTNVALEFSLLESKLFGSVEYFNRDSKDLILGVPQSLITGFGSSTRNIGQINNKGIEIEIGSDLIKKENFKWTLSINGSHINSNVIALNEDEDIIWSDPTGGDARTRFIFREGQSTLAFFGLEWAGTDQTNGKNVWYVNAPDGAGGDFDFNGRAATYDYTKANRVIIGNGNPQFYGGINSDLTYRNFSLGLNLIYKIGGDLYDAASRDVADDGYYWERIRSQYFVDNTWSPSNTSGTLPMVSGRDLEDVNQISSRHLYDASFLRLKNIQLAYKIPSSITNRLKMGTARVYFNGANLLTVSKFKNADPEVNQYSSRGWEVPIAKTYTFGVDFSF